MHDPTSHQAEHNRIKRIFKLVIVVTRLACLLLGTSLVLLSLPAGLLAASAPQGEPMTPAWTTIVFVVLVGALLASGFLMFALLPHAGRSRALCTLNVALLLLPLGLGLLLLNATRVQFPPIGLAYALTGASIWVLALCCAPSD